MESHILPCRRSARPQTHLRNPLPCEVCEHVYVYAFMYKYRWEFLTLPSPSAIEGQHGRTRRFKRQKQER